MSIAGHIWLVDQLLDAARATERDAVRAETRGFVGGVAGDARGDLTFSAVASLDAPTVDLLSAPSRINLNTLRAAYELVASNPFGDIAADVASEVGSQAVELAGEVAGDLADAIPIVGTIFHAVLSVIGIAEGVARAHEEQAEAFCQGFLHTFAIPSGTGSLLAGSVLVPADLFARILPCDEWHGCYDATGDYAGAGKGLQRPWLGQALMRITEGDVWDWGRDINARTRATFGHDPGARSRTNLALLTEAYEGGPWRKSHPGGRAGVAKERRAQFRALRRAIEASYGPSLPLGAQSDGGAALWPVYLDLLLGEIRSGGLSAPGYMGYLLTHDVHWEGGSTPEVREWGWFGQQGSACYERIVDAINALAKQWENSVYHPYYGPGVAKLAELETEAAQVAREKLSGAAPRIVLRPRLRAPARAEPGTHPLVEVGFWLGFGLLVRELVKRL